MIVVIEQLWLIIQTWLSSLTWTLSVSLRRHSSEKNQEQTSHPITTKTKSINALSNSVSRFQVRAWKNETHIKQSMYICLLQQVNTLFTVIWKGNPIFHFSLHINTVFPVVSLPLVFPCHMENRIHNWKSSNHNWVTVGRL